MTNLFLLRSTAVLVMRFGIIGQIDPSPSTGPMLIRAEYSMKMHIGEILFQVIVCFPLSRGWWREVILCHS